MKSIYMSLCLTLVAAIGAATAQERIEPRPVARENRRDQLIDELKLEDFVTALKDGFSTNYTEEKINSVPSRKIMFEESSDARRRKPADQSRSQIALFVASWQIKEPAIPEALFNQQQSQASSGNPKQSAVIPDNDPVWQLSLKSPLDAGNLLGLYRFASQSQTNTKVSVIDQFRLNVKQVPENILTKEQITFLTNSADASTYTTNANISRLQIEADEFRIHEMTITAESVDKVKFYAETILAMSDYGFTRPIQLALLESRKRKCALLQNGIDSAPEMFAKFNAAQAEAKKTQSISLDNIENRGGLTLLKTQIEIDIAGARTRIAACEKQSNGLPGESELYKQLSAIRVANTIELAGLEARLDKTNEYLTAIKNRVTSYNDLFEARNEMRRFRDAHFRTLEDIKYIDANLVRFEPLLIVDNKIVIQPLAASPAN